MSDQTGRKWGCIVSAALFALVGVPLVGLMSMGERYCDIVKSPPCTVSWGWVQLIRLGIVAAACLSIGWAVNLALRRDNSDG